MIRSGFDNALGREGVPKGLSGNVYRPHPIARRRFDFSDATAAAVERAELALVRFDESMREYPYLGAVKRILMRTEAMATVRSDGLDPQFEEHLYLELAQGLGKTEPSDQWEFLAKRFPRRSEAGLKATFEAFQCMDALQWIDGQNSGRGTFTKEEMWELYYRAMRGSRCESERESDTLTDERQVEYQQSYNTGVVYVPPCLDEIDSLIDDLVEFCNCNAASTFARSAVEHFQLEALKPVSAGLDRWGRLIALFMWRCSGICEVVLPPFSLTPALQTQTHTELLIPYQTTTGFSQGTAMDALDRWVRHCAGATERSVKFSASIRDGVSDLEESWRRRAGQLVPGSALDRLLAELAGIPLLSIRQATALIGRKYQAASDAVEHLVEVGILRPLGDQRRNRIFVAHEAFDWLAGIYEAIFSESPIAREVFFL